MRTEQELDEKTFVERELNLLLEMTLRMEYEVRMLDADSEE